MPDNEPKQTAAPCKRCAACDKSACDTFRKVADSKGPDFAARWWDAKEALRGGNTPAEKENPAPGKS